MPLIDGRRMSREEVDAALASCEDDPAWRAAAERLLARGGMRYGRAAAAAIADAFEQRWADSTQARAKQDWRDWLVALSDNALPNARLVCARAWTILGESEAALAAWDRCLEALPEIDSEGLLHRARVYQKLGNGPSAAADLQIALRQPNDYDYWRRAEKLAARITKAHPEVALRSLRIALLSGRASTMLIGSMLCTACFRDGVTANLWSGDYDHYRQDILDAGGALYRFEPDVVICHTHWRDANVPAFSTDPEADIATIVEAQALLWRQLRSRTTAAVIAFTFDLPRHDAYGRLSAQLPGGRIQLLRAANARLREFAAREGITLIDSELVAAQVGAAWEDPREWFMAKLHPAAAGLPALVEHLSATLRAVLGLGRKVLALDLDNVLWGGIIGEEGLAGIQLGSTSVVGEAHLSFQRYVLKLRQRGVLLVVCSKNNETDARSPFELHPDSVLKLDDFAAFAANWQDKATNLRQLAKSLSVGLDSFVFCDDNPVERAWVRSQLPEVAVPELPNDPSGYVDALDRGRWFESITLSEEDRQRHEQYRANFARDRLQESSGSLEEFLAGLQMTARCGPITQIDLPRIAQLVNKTNQFNLTTRRYTEAQLAAQAADERWWTCWFRLADRCGDHGLVGLITCRPRDGETDSLEIDNWLMSCRVLGRSLEALMLERALQACRARDVRRLHGRYIASAKNAQVADLLPRFGFQPSSAGGGAFALDVTTAAPLAYAITVTEE